MLQSGNNNNNMFFVCVTMGLVLLASKYRNNVFRGVKQFCHNIQNKNNQFINNHNVVDKKDYKISFDKIILADSPEKCDYAVQRIRCNLSHGILGFDCEWVNEGPVSILQLATFNGVCALFRIGKIGYIPPKLQELLACRQILKVGVAAYEDGQKIIRDYNCKVVGTVDLRTLAEKFHLPSQRSLAALSLHYLGVEMDKIVEVRLGDWNATTLNDEQVVHAACDAIASALIYDQIIQQASQNYSLWDKITFYLSNAWGNDQLSEYHNLPDGVIDTRFKAREVSINNVNTIENNKNSINMNKNAQVKNLNENTQKNTNIPTRIKPLYHNCYLQAPDGDILCTCDRKKAEWYVVKNLGEIVEEQPFTVRLKFEPSGRALGNVGQYYTQVKVNQCVVCGHSDKFIKKNVVPREYRKYFPLVMKAHQSHDVLLLCPPCHELSNAYDLQLRRKLADMCNAPLLGPGSNDKLARNRRKFFYAVKTLREVTTLPRQKRLDLESFILERTGQQVTPQTLDKLYSEIKNTPVPSPALTSQWQPHGLKVVRYFEKKEGGLMELERIWRENFITVMRPRFLPHLWSTCHNQERLAIRQTQNRIEPKDAKIAGLM